MKSLFGNTKWIKKVKEKSMELKKEDELEEVTCYVVCDITSYRQSSSTVVVDALPDEDEGDIAEKILDKIWKGVREDDVEDIQITELNIKKREKKIPKDTKTLNMFDEND